MARFSFLGIGADEETVPGVGINPVGKDNVDAYIAIVETIKHNAECKCANCSTSFQIATMLFDAGEEDAHNEDVARIDGMLDRAATSGISRTN